MCIPSKTMDAMDCLHCSGSIKLGCSYCTSKWQAEEALLITGMQDFNIYMHAVFLGSFVEHLNSNIITYKIVKMLYTMNVLFFEIKCKQWTAQKAYRKIRTWFKDKPFRHRYPKQSNISFCMKKKYITTPATHTQTHTLQAIPTVLKNHKKAESSSQRSVVHAQGYPFWSPHGLKLWAYFCLQ